MQSPEIVTLPHFKPEEVEALRQEHQRRELAAKTRASLDPDEERVRDAIQREAFWRSQPQSEHRNNELGHALFTQGKIDEALELTADPERRAYYQSIGLAMLKDDDAVCECPETEKVTIDNKEHSSQLWHKIGSFPSAKHGGRLTPIWQCASCGFTNITHEG